MDDPAKINKFSELWEEIQHEVGTSAHLQGRLDKCKEAGYEVERKRSQLIHVISEISEASESLCADDLEIESNFSLEEMKLADAVLRIMEYAEFFGVDVVGAVLHRSKKIKKIKKVRG